MRQLIAALALASALPLCAPVPASGRSAMPAGTMHVFIGSVVGMDRLADPAAVAPMLGTRRIGLYIHAVGYALLAPAQRRALQATWSSTGYAPNGSGPVMNEVAPDDANQATINSPAAFGGSFGREGLLDHIIIGSTAGANCQGSYTAGPGDAHPGRVYGEYCGDRFDRAGAATAITKGVAGGLKSAAYNLTPNGYTDSTGGEDFSDPFATSPYWAPVRAIFTEAGGCGFDTPPSYFWHPTATVAQYQGLIAQEIRWCNARRLRTTVLLSPYAQLPDRYGRAGGDAYDAGLMRNTQRLYAYLRDHDALPTEWVILNYSGTPLPNTVNLVDGSPNGLDTVALWLAAHAKVSAPARAAGTIPGLVSQIGLMVPPRPGATLPP